MTMCDDYYERGVIPRVDYTTKDEGREYKVLNTVMRAKRKHEGDRLGGLVCSCVNTN